jgi:uncharacterized protein GlcG (DUF336 family)
MVGRRIAGVRVFAGRLALYDSAHMLIGAVGVSGAISQNPMLRDTPDRA